MIHDIPYAGCWKVALPGGVLPMVVDELKARVAGEMTEKGFKATWYVILAYGVKP